jgi:hypothetical protein
MKVVAVLTGGACAAIHSGGMHQSVDVDFVLSGRILQDQLDEAMASAGFVRRRDRYVHPSHEVFVEFPRGPLAIGEDTGIRPRRLTRGRHILLALSPTDLPGSTCGLLSLERSAEHGGRHCDRSTAACRPCEDQALERKGRRAREVRGVSIGIEGSRLITDSTLNPGNARAARRAPQA